MDTRRYLKVVAEYDTNGQCRPLLVKREDGKVFSVDHISDVRQAPAIASGGLGIRYTCKIGGRPYYLFNDEGRWFIERPDDSQPFKEGHGPGS